MKIVLAPDKFKNSLTGLEFCNTVEEGILQVYSNVEIIKLPLADGGDGTIDVVDYYLGGEKVCLEVNNPFFKPVKASYLYSEVSKTAFIEMAEASGVKLLSSEQLDCKNATSFGTGEIILDAINTGAKEIILGVGGSATNDCGIGMASALGYRFLDENNLEVKPIGANLSNIKSIDITNVHPKLNDVRFNIACDVTNPLFGKNGAAYIYAEQKGASKDDIQMLDRGLESMAKIIKTVFNVDPQSVKGAGAAGGMGIASKVFLNGNLKPGIELIKNLSDFDTQIKGAKWIITGEGKLDMQTMLGKTINGVLASSKKTHIKVAVFCGSVDLENSQIPNFGIDYVDAVTNYAENLEDAIEYGREYVMQIAKKFAIKILK